MPITHSQTIEASEQRNAVRVVELHTDSTGKQHRISRLLPKGADLVAARNASAAHIDAALIGLELDSYTAAIAAGADVVATTYHETTRPQRSARFLAWAKDRARRGDHQPLRFTPAILDQFSDAEVGALVGPDKVAKLRTWVDKTRRMAEEMAAATIAASEV